MPHGRSAQLKKPTLDSKPRGRDAKMARFEGGWVKIYRAAILGDINSNYTRGGLFCALIAMANIQESTVSWRGKPRKLEKGEIVTSLTELAQLGETDRKTVDKHLNYLRLRGTITFEKSQQGALIKILNFEFYQGLDASGGKRGRNAMDNGMDNGVAHIEEVKNIRMEEEKKRQPPEPPLEPLFPSNELVDSRLSKVSREVQESWLKLYSDKDWVFDELKAAVGWAIANPAKAPRSDWSRFFTNWLKRSSRYLHKGKTAGRKQNAPAGDLQRNTSASAEFEEFWKEAIGDAG